MDTLVIPNMEDGFKKERAMDEMPQSAAGRTIMTTEPKFIPEDAVELNLENSASFRVRLIDCVGYIVPSSLGYIENDEPRMVKTPWYDEEIPFVEAAEIGTEKVIRDHSSIGIVVTTDGSFGEINRSSYVETEQRVIEELKSYGKPFIVVLNSAHPMLPETERLATNLNEEYGVPVLPINVENMNDKDIYDILKNALYEFPVLEVNVSMPEWIACLSPNNWLKKIYIEKIKESVSEIDKLKDIRCGFKSTSCPQELAKGLQQYKNNK